MLSPLNSRTTITNVFPKLSHNNSQNIFVYEKRRREAKRWRERQDKKSEKERERKGEKESVNVIYSE